MITRWASERKPALIPENPFDSFELPKAPERYYQYWSLDDEDKFFDWLDQEGPYRVYTTKGHSKKGGGNGSKFFKPMKVREHVELRDIVMMALRTGMRIGEIGALRSQDINLSEGYISVVRNYSTKEAKLKQTTKNRRPRRIEINDDVPEILEKRRFKPQSEPLFNIRMNTIKFFSRTCRWAGVKEIHFHSLRHTALTNLANGYGMDKPLPVPKVQQIAGHSDIQTTMRYVHADEIKDTASLQWSRSERKSKRESQMTR